MIRVVEGPPNGPDELFISEFNGPVVRWELP